MLYEIGRRPFSSSIALMTRTRVVYDLSLEVARRGRWFRGIRRLVLNFLLLLRSGEFPIDFVRCLRNFSDLRSIFEITVYIFLK